MTLVEILRGANVALALIQARLILILALLMTFSLFAWAMWQGTVLAIIIAATWGLLIFLPILYMGKRGYDAEADQGQPERTERQPATRAPDGARDADAD